MKIKVEIDSGLQDLEVLIKSPEMNEEVIRLQNMVAGTASVGSNLIFYKKEKEFYFKADQVLFFETEGNDVYAHTKDDSFQVRHKLYELETLLPVYFMRVSKSTILNTREIYSISRNLTAASLIEFHGTHKTVFVSRNYYRVLYEKLMENRENGKK